MRDKVKHVLETTQGWKRRKCLKDLGFTEAAAVEFLRTPVEPVKPKTKEKTIKKVKDTK